MRVKRWCVWFPLTWLTVLVSCFEVSQGGYAHCVALQGALCVNVGYNASFFPNLFNHESEEEATQELNKFLPLVQAKCSVVLMEFLCSLYLPPCTALSYTLPPCRQLCTQVHSDCDAIMNNYTLQFPSQFACETLPEIHELLCFMKKNNSVPMVFSPALATEVGDDKENLVEESEGAWGRGEPRVAEWSRGEPKDAEWGRGDSRGQRASVSTKYEIREVGVKLTQCASNADCIFERSVCRGGECVCEYPRTWGPHGCEETQILGGPCVSGNQCTAVTPNAVCGHEGMCTCPLPLTSYMNLACIHASEVGALCYNDAQCRALNSYAFCRFIVSQVVGTCQCDPDQFVSPQGRCLPRLGGRCTKGECPRQLGAATCIRGRDAVLRCFCSKNAKQIRGVCVPQS